MLDQLTDVEARILGSLVEKSLTTPELYPLTLNAVVTACNQKNNREPIMTLGHAEVEKALNALVDRKFAARVHETGARAVKYSHHIEVLLCSEDPKVIGAMCVLLLRGPQTIGEIKGRSERLCQFAGTSEVDSLLAELSSRADGPIVARLPRQPGQKEARYQQLFAARQGTPAASEVPPEGGRSPIPQGPPAQPKPGRPSPLEERVAALEAAVRELQTQRLDSPRPK